MVEDIKKEDYMEHIGNIYIDQLDLQLPNCNDTVDKMFWACEIMRRIVDDRQPLLCYN